MAPNSDYVNTACSLCTQTLKCAVEKKWNINEKECLTLSDLVILHHFWTLKPIETYRKVSGNDSVARIPHLIIKRMIFFIWLFNISPTRANKCQLAQRISLIPIITPLSQIDTRHRSNNKYSFRGISNMMFL